MSRIERVISSDEQDNEQELAESLTTDVIKKRSVKGVMAYALRTFALQGIGILANAALAVFLSPEEFGIYFLVGALINLFAFLSDVGLAATLIQKKTQPTVAELRTTFTVQQFLSTGIFALIVALTPYWKSSQGFGNSELWLLYALASAFWIASLKTIPSILLERKLRFDLLVIPAMLENIIFYSVVVVLAWRGFGINSYTAAIFARGIIGVIAIYFLQRWPFGFAFDMTSFRSLLRFGAKFQLNDLLARIKDELFIVFLRGWIGDEPLGFVSWAKKWSLYPYQLSVNSVMAVTFPTFSRIQDEKEKLAKAIEKSLYFISLAIFPLLAGMAVLIFPLLTVFEPYQKWQPAAWSLAWFCLSIAGSALSTPLTNTLNAIGEINTTLKLMVLWTILTWTITPLCLHFFGFTGVSIAAVLINFTSILPIYLVKRIVPIRVWPQLWRQLVASIVMILVGVAGLSLWDNSILYLLAGGIVMGAAYGLTFLTIGWRSLQTELRFIGVLK